MRKGMLIIIALLSLSFVGNAFGQAADWEIKPAIKNPKNSIKKTKQVQPGNGSKPITNQKSSGKRRPTAYSLTEIEIDGFKKPNTENEKGHKPKGWIDGSFDLGDGVTSSQTKPIEKAPAKFQDGEDIILRRSAKSQETNKSSRKTTHKRVRSPKGKQFYEDMMEGTGIRRKQPRKRN